MRYGNKSFQHINESEKRQILSLYKKMDLQNIFETKKYKTDIQELISDFSKYKEDIFQPFLRIYLLTRVLLY
jgi:hypothetical protein